MAKIIKLTQGKKTIVDDEDFEILSRYKWCYNTGYAVRNIYPVDWKHPVKIFMHRQILGDIKKDLIDHINQNPLDNRKVNLRVATKSQNAINCKIYRSNSSGIKGVGWYKKANKWLVQLTINHRKLYLGLFKDFNEAVKTRKLAEERYFS